MIDICLIKIYIYDFPLLKEAFITNTKGVLLSVNLKLLG